MIMEKWDSREEVRLCWGWMLGVHQGSDTALEHADLLCISQAALSLCCPLLSHLEVQTPPWQTQVLLAPLVSLPGLWLSLGSRRHMFTPSFVTFAHLQEN